VGIRVKEGHLYELDGRKKFPVNHGPSSPDTLLEVCVVAESTPSIHHRQHPDFLGLLLWIVSLLCGFRHRMRAR
jgi:hypothetical protein